VFFDAVSSTILYDVHHVCCACDGIMWVFTHGIIRGRCDANDQFVSFDNGDTDVSEDLTGFEWIGDVESFTCSEQIDR
jgi:hypothetical protein